MLDKKYSKFVFFIIPTFVLLFSGCAYYNTFYNAKQFYKDAEKDRIEREKKMVVELTEQEKAERKKAGEATVNASEKPSQQEMQNYQKAIERASRVLEFYPDSKYVDDALMLLGRCFYYRQEYQKSQRKFEEIMQLYPDSDFIPEAKLLMAKCKLGLEEFDEAETQFLNLSIAKNTPKEIQEEAKFELAGLYFKKQSYELAAQNFASSAKEADDKLIRAMSLYRLGECNIELQDFQEAINLFNRSAKESPNEEFKSQATYKLGAAYGFAQEYDNAIETYDKLLSTEYDDTRIPMIKLALAENLQKKGEMEESVNWYLNIIEEHKRTDASARSFYALGLIEEYINKDYQRAKENYDMVRSEFANSLIAPDAKDRSDNIRLLLDLNKEIAKLEGRYVETDSTEGEGDPNQMAERDKRDDAPISLSSDGMWINYAGRHRPPPTSLLDLTEEDLERSAIASQMAATTDSTDSTGAQIATKPAVLDSATLAEMKAKQEKEKIFTLAEKRMALAEILFFNFDKPDSAARLYETIIENQVDSSISTSAMYSLGYLYQNILQDSIKADSVLNSLIVFNPESEQAKGAKKLLGIPIVEDKIDSAFIFFKNAENAYWEEENPDKAIELYEYVIEHYPESEYAPKSAFARAWMYEKILIQPEQALELYKNFVEQWPETEYTQKMIKPRLAAVDNYLKAEEAKQKAIADSIAQAEAALQDSLNAANGDSLAATTVADSLDTNSVSQNDSTVVNQGKKLPLPANVNAQQPSENQTDDKPAAEAKPPENQEVPALPPASDTAPKDKGKTN